MMQQQPGGVAVGNDGLPLHFADNLKRINSDVAKALYKSLMQQRQKGASLQAIEATLQKGGHTNSVIAKELKDLVTKGLIVMIQVNNRKMYYATEYRPQEQNKPTWYLQGHYDEAYVTHLFQLIKSCVGSARTQAVTMDYIVNLIRNSQNLRARILDEEVKTLVAALVNSCELIEYEHIAMGQKCYILPASANQGEQFQPYFQGNYWRTTPCGKCQMLNLCGPSQGISASICPYMREWLQGK